MDIDKTKLQNPKINAPGNLLCFKFKFYQNASRKEAIK